MSFQAEQRLVKLRPRATKLVLPTLLLGLIAGAVTFAENRNLETWLIVAIHVAAALATLIFWSVPLTRHIMRSLELTTSRLIWRDGVFGRNRREISWFEVSAVEHVRGKVMVYVHGDEPLILVGLPKGKKLAAQMQDLVRG